MKTTETTKTVGSSIEVNNETLGIVIKQDTDYVVVDIDEIKELIEALKIMTTTKMYTEEEIEEVRMSGYEEGYSKGYDEGKDDGYDEGVDDSEDRDEYDEGYDEGFDKGYDKGYDDAEEDE